MNQADKSWLIYEKNRSRSFRAVVAKYRLQYGRHPPPGFKEVSLVLPRMSSQDASSSADTWCLSELSGISTLEKGKPTMSMISHRSWMIYDPFGQLIPESFGKRPPGYPTLSTARSPVCIYGNAELRNSPTKVGAPKPWPE